MNELSAVGAGFQRDLAEVERDLVWVTEVDLAFRLRRLQRNLAGELEAMADRAAEHPHQKDEERKEGEESQRDGHWSADQQG